MAKSRYSFSGIIDDNHFSSFTLDQTNRIREVDTFRGVNTFEYVVKRGDRLDHLAARYLHDDRYYWVIALINSMTMPVIGPGDKIRIPFDVNDVLDRI